jgi:hypothetical protein
MQKAAPALVLVGMVTQPFAGVTKDRHVVAHESVDHLVEPGPAEVAFAWRTHR